jgi:hypothetical protein
VKWALLLGIEDKMGLYEVAIPQNQGAVLGTTNDLAIW